MVEESIDFIDSSIHFSLVIPVYHEEENVEILMSELNKFLSNQDEVLFIYDSVTDPTVAVLEDIQLRVSKTIRLIKNTRGVGFRSAVLAGLAEAKNQWIAVVMADLSDPIELLVQIKQMIISSSSAEVVVASRFLNENSKPVQATLKGWLSFAASRSLKCFGFPVSDFTNNFRVYKKSALEKLILKSEGGMELSAEIVLRLVESGSQILEVPTSWKDREKGASHFRFAHWFPRYLKLYLEALIYCFKNSRLGL